MFNNRTQKVNVDRLNLINHLKDGLVVHKNEYTESVVEYEAAVIKFLEDAANRAKNGDFTNLVLRLNKPENHENDYIHLIEMLEQSVDETIQLDSDAFRAYFKGEWDWKSRFNDSVTTIKGYLAS